MRWRLSMVGLGWQVGPWGWALGASWWELSESELEAVTVTMDGVGVAAGLKMSSSIAVTESWDEMMGWVRRCACRELLGPNKRGRSAWVQRWAQRKKRFQGETMWD